jgi:trehalose 6-phosphate phosphatase
MSFAGDQGLPAAVRDQLFAKGCRLAVFLDFDGTLVDIAPTPDAVVVPPGLTGLLMSLRAKLGGALAVLSGRAIADIDRRLGVPELTAAGQHGLETRDPDGHLWRAGNAATLTPLRADLLAFAAERTGVLLEDKGTTVALHTRLAPQFGGEATALVQALRDRDPERWRIRPGHHVVEIGLGGADKGTALQHFAALVPFAGRIPVMFGDDVTDDAAFAATKDLGGFAVAVGPRPADTPLRLKGPAEVSAVLRLIDEAFET